MNTISLFLQNICLCVTQFCDRNLWTNLYEILYLVPSYHKLVLIRFWCMSLKKFLWCSKFSIPLTRWYRRKLHAIIPKPIILKFKTLFIIAIVRWCIIFVYMGAILPPQGRNFLTLVFLERTFQNTQN